MGKLALGRTSRSAAKLFASFGGVANVMNTRTLVAATRRIVLVSNVRVLRFRLVVNEVRTCGLKHQKEKRSMGYWVGCFGQGDERLHYR